MTWARESISRESVLAHASIRAHGVETVSIVAAHVCPIWAFIQVWNTTNDYIPANVTEFIQILRISLAVLNQYQSKDDSQKHRFAFRNCASHTQAHSFQMVHVFLPFTCAFQAISLTCTFETTANPPRSTTTLETAGCVGAGCMSIAIMGSDFTLIDIWQRENKKQHKEK